MKKNNILKTLALSLSLFLSTSTLNIVKAYASEPEIIATSAITMDLETKEVIYSKNADSKMSPASTTKLMTALLFAEKIDKNQIISYTADSSKIVETSINNYIPAKVGDKISADDLMKAVMIYSANDTAYLMAEAVAGTVKDFIPMMNEKAKELGLKNTTFYNPSGLEIDPLNPTSNSINETTAYDLAIIASEAFKNEWILNTVAPKTDKPSIKLGEGTMLLDSRNLVLGKNGNIGGKTGTEELAGRCFVGLYERDGRKLITVVLNSEYGVDGMPVFNDTEKIADFGYGYTKSVYKTAGEEVLKLTLTYKPFIVFGTEKTIEVPVKLNQDVNYYLNSFNDKYSQITYNSETTDAWKLSGNKEVKLTYSSELYSEEVSATIELSTFSLIKANILSYALVLIVAIIAIALLLFIIRIINMKKRRRRRRRY